MVHLVQYFHIRAFELAEEIYSLRQSDGEKYPDADVIYDFLREFFKDYTDMEDSQVAYANCNFILKISNETNFLLYKWLGQYMVRAIMENNTDVLDMNDVFCVVF